MSLPKVSCFCCTYGRPHLLEEAIESFLRQDYQGEKELVILNDFAGHTLVFEHPEVTIINLTERIMPLGRKFNLAGRYCLGDILMPWEDDDIYLPWRLSLSVALMQDGLFHTNQAWIENESHLLSYSENLYQCNLAIAKPVWDKVGGYLEEDVSAIDLALYRALGGHKISQQLERNQLFYIYRWQSSGSFHASDLGGNCTGMSDYFGFKVEQLAATGKVPLGEVHLKPQWPRDYVALVQDTNSTTLPDQNENSLQETMTTKPCIKGISVGTQLWLNVPFQENWLLLDRLASEIWRYTVFGNNKEETARALKQHFHQDYVYALSDIKNLLANFTQVGLLNDWIQPLWLQIGEQIVAIVINDDAIREKLLLVYPALQVSWPVNWDRIIEIREEREFFSVYVDEQLDANLLYAEQALFRVLEQLSQMKATVTKHALYLQGALLTTNNQIIAIAAATIDVLLPILEGTLPSNIKLLSVGRFELDSPTSVKAVYDPLINIDVRLAPKVKPVASIYANNKVQHLFACQTNSVDAKKTYHVDKLYLIDESSDINSVTPAQALSILLSKQIVKSNALSQSKARDLVTWLENTKLYALPANSILAVMNSNKSQFDTFAVESETTDSFLSPSHIPQFKKFSKQGSQAINLHLLPNEAKRKENIQRFASISTNPSIELIEWARKRLESGDSKAQIYRDLLDTGYCMELAQKAMYGFKPQVKREQIEHASERKSLETTPSLYFAFANLAITEDQTCERIADTRAQIYIKEHAFSEEECQALLELIKGHFQPSTVVDQVGNSNDGYRTSSTAFLEQISAEKNQQVKSRIGQMMGIDDAYLESLQVQRYGTGQEYKVHCDFFHSSSPTFRACTDKVGQRTWTCVLYLNDDFEGGATRFNLLDKNVQPKRGMALCWNNLLPLGKPNEWTSHCGEPVKKGYKYIISAWFREKPYS